MPKVSVVILTFNRATLLSRSIQSVLDQTFQNFELIVVDDCSTDHTPQTVKNFSDTRIKYVRHEKNRGEAEGRNTGLKYAKGQYIGYLDDDDEWLPEKLQLQVERLDRSRPQIGAVYCGRMDVDVETGKEFGVRVYHEKGDLFSRLLRGNFLTLSSILLRTECFEKVGEFDQNIPFGLDYDMWLRISQCYEFECVPKPLVKYGIHSKALSNNLDLKIKGQEAWLKKHDQFFRKNLKGYSDLLYGLGILYCMNGETKKSRKAILCAIQSYPKSLKSYVVFVGSYLGSFGFNKVLYVWGKITGRRVNIPSINTSQ